MEIFYVCKATTTGKSITISALLLMYHPFIFLYYIASHFIHNNRVNKIGGRVNKE